MREAITTALDVLALLLVAAGLGLAVAGWERPGLGVAVAGVVVGVGAQLAARLAGPRRPPEGSEAP